MFINYSYIMLSLITLIIYIFYNNTFLYFENISNVFTIDVRNCKYTKKILKYIKT